MRWRLKSLVSWLFTQPIIRAHIKENIKARRHWPLCGEFTVDRWIPAQMASNAENVSIWWRHHECCEFVEHRDQWINKTYQRMLHNTGNIATILASGVPFTRRDQLNQHRIRTWIIKYIYVEQWDVITHPLPNFNNGGFIGTWMTNHTPQKTMSAIT